MRSITPIHFAWPAAIAIWLVLSADSSRAQEVPSAQADFDQTVLPFLNTHCLRCHGEQEQKGELRLDTLSRDVAAGGSGLQWGDVMYRISSGEMPPEEEPQPKAEESARIAEWLAGKLKEGEAARLAKRDRVTFHKLTRAEYANTLYDLLGVHYDAADRGNLLEDPEWHGFERIGSVLSLSPAHIEKYLAAADTVLAEAMPAKPPEKLNLHWGPLDLRSAIDPETRKRLKEEGRLDKLRVEVWPGVSFWGHGAGPVQSVAVPVAGEYRVRVKLSGLKPADGPAPHLIIYAADLSRMLFEQDVVAPEDQPVTLEFCMHLPAGSHALRMCNEVPGPSVINPHGHTGPRPYFSTKDGRDPWQTKLTDEDGQAILPFLIVDWVEWEGPIEDSTSIASRQQCAPPASGDPVQTREILARFIERAFRRPVKPEELDRFVKLLESEIASGETFAAAYRTTLLSVLCSNDVLYLVEGAPESVTERINDWELASRLSYFLWSTMPDAPLLTVARNGTLHQPEVLREQLHRMLRDPRSAQFTTAFPREWLQLRRVGMFPPDNQLYPNYDDYLQTCFVTETTSYFREVLEKNLGLREFLDSDWTMLNARLADHYRIPNVAGDRFVRVALRPEDHRGGLLTQAAILSLTSDGTRHRPVHRGKWILESIVGKSPPPPPANVKPIEPTPAGQPKTTLRMKLAAHRGDAHCAACHRKIDPLGLAFDNYDAIGRWRTEEIVSDGSGQNPPVDASGELSDGRKFSNAAELKKLLLTDLDKFNAAFVEKLATFALRRTMTIDDRAALALLAQQSKAADYRLAAIVEDIVLSDLFQKR